MPVVITGLGSVSPFGPRCGPIADDVPELRPVARWATDGVRRARLVPPFKPAEVIAGLKTRRMDRLSVWALVAAGLALKDAGLEPGQAAPERAGVTFGTAFGCLELTEAFMQSIAENGHDKADPIVFPETLGNQPASHVARQFGFKGPNVTVSRGFLSGEVALLSAVAQLQGGEASLVLALAGDVVTRGLFAWYEAAGRLSAECYGEPEAGKRSYGDLTPGEGVAAVVLETLDHAASRGARPRGRFLATLHERGPAPDDKAAGDGWKDLAARALAASGATDPLRFLIAGPGIRDSLGVTEVHGMFGAGALLGLSLALSASGDRIPGVGVALGAGGRGERVVFVLTREAGRE